MVNQTKRKNNRKNKTQKKQIKGGFWPFTSTAKVAPIGLDGKAPESKSWSDTFSGFNFLNSDPCAKLKAAKKKAVDSKKTADAEIATAQAEVDKNNTVCPSEPDIEMKGGGKNKSNKSKKSKKSKK